ncbi:hypothetical protein [Gellertiella hungarica]|uniref:Uncharacterized protein n=1 Tax=Gellertiella hungarica TaxID=1572859 RepID=A0A7W6J2M1_9HYPH|nr:hypothetical protein [Gellertiella hungarica]MBB4063644.1 hypothetical protein [Gellertiella hungarica]
MTKHHERAFPLHPGILPEWQDNAGMTKREYFAGLAMQGLLGSNGNDGTYMRANEIVREAVWYADALIAELAKGGEA